ncbi:MAG: hypothetical protein SOR23_05430 [Candidatus Enterosoma sp.]|nr:hypothetical protein [Bacilli bacterium]MDY3047656.1 hypothetical protein [Candidatus Enterosoma sp.]
MSNIRLLNLPLIFYIASSLSPIATISSPNSVSSEISKSTSVATPLVPIESDRYLGMKTYFRYLYTNMPQNDFGSCGFVSLVSCLSYYDSYYNDTIIDEKYDVESHGSSVAEVAQHSPGVTKVTSTASLNNLTNNEINTYKKNFIISNKSTDFQYDLMYTYNTKVLGRTNSSPKFDAAIGMWEYQDLLNAYYGNNKILFNYVSSSIYGSNVKDSSVQIQIRQYVYDMLEEGYPVILHIVDEQNDKKKYYHSIVAYDYDINVLDCNFGYNNSDYSAINLNQHNYYITEAGRFDLTSFHEIHSTNYVINGRPYCGCGYSE